MKVPDANVTHIPRALLPFHPGAVTGVRPEGGRPCGPADPREQPTARSHALSVCRGPGQANGSPRLAGPRALLPPGHVGSHSGMTMAQSLARMICPQLGAESVQTLPGADSAISVCAVVTCHPPRGPTHGCHCPLPGAGGSYVPLLIAGVTGIRCPELLGAHT